DNDWRLRAIAREYTDIVCAWGANAKPERVEAVTSILTAAGGRLWCLGTTKEATRATLCTCLEIKRSSLGRRG
ncbi:DUF1643 domain-containing protein, partial [Pseudomonas aeruginosa]|uniref:DUF1643 domain-containing protein n=1 Tax=Pseudomonas aeruginosa TaxID=287 RepID=UPI001F550701